MVKNLFEVGSPEALEQALCLQQPGDVLAFRPVGAEQVSLFRKGGGVTYYCDLNRRAPTAVVMSAVNAAGLALKDVNEKERRADQMQGFVPTASQLTYEEAVKKLSSYNKKPSVPLPSDTRLSRLFSAFFNQRIIKTKNKSVQPSDSPTVKR